MTKQLFLLLILTSVHISCNNEEENYGVIPRCINNLITEFKQSASCNNSKVDQYLFQDQIVFVFAPGTCGADMQAPVIGFNCDTLGALGGIAGNTEINGEDFANAQFIKTVWEK